MKKRVLSGVVALAMAVVLAGPAGAASAEQGGVQVPTGLNVLGDNASKPGGGFWNWGTGGGQVYSKYHHPSKYHSATACDRRVFETCVKRYAAAGAWANATTASTWNAADYAYWATY